MIRRTILSAVSLVLVAVATGTIPQAAQWVGIDPHTTRVQNGASIELAGVILPDTGTPSMAVQFTLPKNYRKNSDLTLRVLGGSNTMLTGCGYAFQPAFAMVFRPGEDFVLVPTDGGSFLPEDGNPVITAAGQKVFEKAYTLSTGNDFTLERGAAITVAFIRNAASGQDTCMDELLIAGIRAEYKTK